MFPPAPGRFSITTCCPQVSDSFWPRARAMMSLGPPGVNPTMKRAGFSGKAPACATAAESASTKTANRTIAPPRPHDTQGPPRLASLRMPAMPSAPHVSPLMQRLAAYIAGALRKPLPAAVAEKTRHHLLDTLAAMVSGSRLRPGREAIAFARSQGGGRDACVIGSRAIASAVTAALANGMLAHADETDDSHSRSQTHPGCGVVAASLAMAERERAGGKALLRAVALGYDVCCRLTQSLNAMTFRSAGHSTHSFGPTFGAAAAAGALAGVDARGVRYLLSYAAQQASGISCWMRDEEHIEKAFDFGGMPARNGVAAAAMVAHGFTGLEDVLSGERNFFVAYGSSPDPEELARELGERYEIVQ